MRFESKKKQYSINNNMNKDARLLEEAYFDVIKNAKSKMFPNKKLEDLKSEYKRHAKGLLRADRNSPEFTSEEDALDYYKRKLIDAGMSLKEVQDFFSEIDKEVYEIRRNPIKH